MVSSTELKYPALDNRGDAIMLPPKSADAFTNVLRE
jgi:hypothetical protein